MPASPTPTPSRCPGLTAALAAALLALATLATPDLGRAQDNRPRSADPFAAIARQKLVQLEVGTAPEQGRSVVLRVVDQDEAPLEGVDVLVLEASAMRSDAARKIMLRFQDPRQDLDMAQRFVGVAAELGTRHRTDAEGLVRVSWQASAQAFVVHQREVTTVLLREEDEPVEVTMRVVPKLAVTVRDHRGRPAAGVLVKRVPIGTDGWRLEYEGDGVTTGVDGVALLPLPKADAPASEILATIATRALPRRLVEPGATAVELTLPPCGSVRVYFQGLPRPLDAAPASITLGTGERFDSAWRRPDEIGPDFATFHWVGVGEPLQLEARIGAVGLRNAAVEAPTIPGEMKVATLQVERLRSARQILVSTADGAPLANAAILVAFRRPGETESAGRQTGADGTLRLEIDQQFDPADADVLIVARRGDVSLGYAIRPLTDLLDTAAAGAPTVADDKTADAAPVEFRLEPEPVLVAGRVLDPSGQPAAGIEVFAEFDIEIPSNQGGSSSSSSSVADVYQRTTCITDAEGRFEIREPTARRGPVALRIGGDGAIDLAAEASFNPGAIGVEVRICKVGAFALPAHGLDPDQRLLPPIRFVDAASRQYFDPRLDTRRDPPALVFEGLRPGSYKLAFRDPTGTRELLEVDGLEVRADGTLDDPRLAELDWREHYRLARITAVDADGRVIPEPRVVSTVTGLPSYARRVASEELDDGSVRIWIRKARQPAIEVQHPLHRTTRVEWPDDVAAERSVTMERRPALRVRLATGVTLPAGLDLIASAHARGDDRDPDEGRYLFLSLGFSGPSALGLAPTTIRPDCAAGPVAVDLVGRLDRELAMKLMQTGARLTLRFTREAAARLETDPDGIPELVFEPTEQERLELQAVEEDLARLRDR